MSASFIYLASQSPRRAQLLEQLGVRHRLLLADPAEDAEALEVILPGELPIDYVQRVTHLKLLSAISRFQKKAMDDLNAPKLADTEGGDDDNSQGYVLAPILCADTTVALGNKILGKPLDDLDAIHTLQSLSGKTHQVLTAICVGIPDPVNPLEKLDPSWGGPLGAKFFSALSISSVEFDTLSVDQIKAYVQSGEPQGKAGAYAVQGRAGGFIKKIEGSYSGIMGLPLYECGQILERLGVAIL
jgi:septum formation protein